MKNTLVRFYKLPNRIKDTQLLLLAKDERIKELNGQIKLIEGRIFIEVNEETDGILKDAKPRFKNAQTREAETESRSAVDPGIVKMRQELQKNTQENRELKVSYECLVREWRTIDRHLSFIVGTHKLPEERLEGYENVD